MVNKEERIKAAYTAWEKADARRQKLGREMDRIEKPNHPMGPEYVLQCEEIETVRVMYAALILRIDQLWNYYASLAFSDD